MVKKKALVGQYPIPRPFLMRNWLRGADLNGRPPGYEPDELPGCSTPRMKKQYTGNFLKVNRKSRNIGSDIGESPSNLRILLDLQYFHLARAFWDIDQYLVPNFLGNHPFGNGALKGDHAVGNIGVGRAENGKRLFLFLMIVRRVALAGQLERWKKASRRRAQGRTPEEIGAELKVPPFFQGVFFSRLKRLSALRLQNLTEALLACDEQFKSGRCSERLAMESFIWSS